MGLSSEQVAQFREDGFVAVEGFFTPRETDALRMELTRIYDERRKAGTLRNVAVQEDGSQNRLEGTRQNLQVIPLNDKSPLYRALPFHPKALETIESLIGDRFRLQLDQAFWKPARQGIGTSWHQDNAYFKIADPLRGTAMWIAIHDATVENGCMHVIPGSHRETYPHYRDPLSDHHIRCDPPEEREVAVELEAGGALFFAYGTAHCTKANRSDHDRAGAALHFIHTDYTDGDHWKLREQLQPILRGPDATGGLREYGERIEGTWDAVVETILGGHGISVSSP
jgi:phytanoyl-CoA hydroxylase